MVFDMGRGVKIDGSKYIYGYIYFDPSRNNVIITDKYFLKLHGKSCFRVLTAHGPLGTSEICHNKYEHLPQIDSRIIIAPVIN